MPRRRPAAVAETNRARLRR